MHNFEDALYVQGASGMVSTFLEAIKTGDTLTFWKLLDKQGQGYFMGMWFFALGNSDLAGISLLAEDENFLRDALSGIVSDLRANLDSFLDSPRIGNLHYTDSHHARVPVMAGTESGDQQVTEHIPLVLELAPAGSGTGGNGAMDGNVGMTCWKIDTLKCFRIQKS